MQMGWDGLSGAAFCAKDGSAAAAVAVVGFPHLCVNVHTIYMCWDYDCFFFG